MIKIKIINNLKIKFTICTIAVIVLLCFFHWQNNDIIVSKYYYTNKKITSENDGYTIIQISDLHNKEFGSNNKKLIAAVKK